MITSEDRVNGDFEAAMELTHNNAVAAAVKGHGKRGRGAENKTPVFALVERNADVRSTPVERVTGVNLKAVIRQNTERRLRS